MFQSASIIPNSVEDFQPCSALRIILQSVLPYGNDWSPGRIRPRTYIVCAAIRNPCRGAAIIWRQGIPVLFFGEGTKASLRRSWPCPPSWQSLPSVRQDVPRRRPNSAGTTVCEVRFVFGDTVYSSSFLAYGDYRCSLRYAFLDDPR